MITIGTDTTNISRIVLENEDYSKAYLGSDLLWSRVTSDTIVSCVYYNARGYMTTYNNQIISSGITAVTLMSVDGRDYEDPVTCYDFVAQEPIGCSVTVPTVDSQMHTVDFVLSAGTKTLSRRAFYNCQKLQTIVIPDGITSIGSSCFESPIGNTYLTHVTMPNSLTSIGASAFSNCIQMKEIVIPTNVRTIGKYAFYYCYAADSGVTIPEGITELQEYTFAACRKVPSVILSSTITSIGNRCFNGCTGLTDVTCNATTPPSMGENVFNNTQSLTNIYVPSSSVDAYKAASGWSDYASIITGISS